MQFFLQKIDAIANGTTIVVCVNNMNAGGGRDLRRQSTLFFAGKKINQIFADIFWKIVYASIASPKSIDSIKLAT